jgi:putative ABC transport system ATP-binding protein
VRLVSARGVVKSVGSGRARRTLLDGAGLEADRGELIAILGRSGTGKSTFLNLLGGIDRPDSGVIDVGGERLDSLDERGLTRYRRESVGFVFQLFHLIEELTAEQNVMLAARMTGNGSIERARELLDRFGVDGVADQLPHTLSGGEQQRVAIARALVNDPGLILADEPTGNLDSEAAANVLATLRRLADDGRAVLLVTHEREAAAVADRVLVLEDGRLSS